ncbi:hypothetical protein WJ21_18590 [Burkholderia vietnamiensis]|nr:hypothetical protein WJ21_18590 [Burkholderia vietnamiensis]
MLARQRIKHIHCQIADVIQPCGKGHLAVKLSGFYVRATDDRYRHRQMTECQVDVWMWAPVD